MARESQENSAPVVWAVDFQFDVCEQGKAFNICCIVDEHTRECICGLVERSITADRFIDHLEALIAQGRSCGLAQ